MTLLAAMVALVLASALMAGAFAKATFPDRLKVTLVALGVPVRWSQAAVRTIILAEAGTACALLIWPSASASLIACLGVFAAFSWAGAKGLRAEGPVACACFTHEDSVLGWRQIAQLPVAGAAAALAHAYGDWRAQEGALLVIAAVAGHALFSLTRIVGPWRRTRAMRLAIRQTRLANQTISFDDEDLLA